MGSRGGNPQRGVIIPVPVEVPDYDTSSYIEEFGWEDKFVFGMHQRDDIHIFSPVPLEAYDDIQSDDTAFLILEVVQIIENKQNLLQIEEC